MTASIHTRHFYRSPSPFLGLEGIEYFHFEEDFMANGIRCIPMVIRMKMDKAGIKLKLGEWNRFNITDRITLAQMPSHTAEDIKAFGEVLAQLIKDRAGKTPAMLAVDPIPVWHNTSEVPAAVSEKATHHNATVSLQQWQRLTPLQRFALVKLCRPSHQNKNFPVALKEFGLIS